MCNRLHIGQNKKGYVTRYTYVKTLTFESQGCHTKYLKCSLQILVRNEKEPIAERVARSVYRFFNGILSGDCCKMYGYSIKSFLMLGEKLF